MGTALAQTASVVEVMRGSKKAQAAIMPFLPEGVSYDRVVASVQMVMARAKAESDRKGEKQSPLERCTQMSVVLSVAKVMQWGLEIGETAHLVPFGTNCTPVADYKGLAELVVSAGVVRHVDAHCIYKNERFVNVQGTNPHVEHHPIADPKERGDLAGAYAIFWLRHNHFVVCHMAATEIDAIRQQHSKQWKSGPLPYWYALKTVVRRGVKLLPKNAKLAKVLAVTDEDEAIDAGQAPVMAAQVAAPATDTMTPRPLATSGMDGYTETAKVVTASPVGTAAWEEATRVLAEQGENGYEPPF